MLSVLTVLYDALDTSHDDLTAAWIRSVASHLAVLVLGRSMASTILGIGALCCLPLVCASITVYSQQPFAGTATGTANVVAYTGAAAYDPTVLIPPPIPNPAPPMQFTQQLSSIPPPGVSIPQSGHFYGFSVEFSVINQILGINGSFLQVPWLNLMSNMQARGGSVRVRIGGNTQETAALVWSLPDDKMMEKVNATDDPLEMLTPPLLYTPEVVYMLANISALVNVQWYLGIPLNDTQHLRLAIAEVAEQVLGDNLLGFQVGNEPDQYGIHNHRPITYSPEDYSGDFGLVEAAMRADPNISSVVRKLIGPSVSGNWKLEDIWATGFLSLYEDSLAALSVEYYPNNNCAKVLNSSDAVVDPQRIFSDYLNHTAAQIIVNKYLPSTLMAQSLELPFLMFETNSASCGGFAGVSDSFGSSLWALDYGLQMAYSNFTGALLHIGGQGNYYNPFTPPPTNQSVYHAWTIGPIYYSALIVAEVFGKSNKSRIIDLQLNNENIFTPGYAIYDNDILSRLALINYITDPSGSSDYTATFSFDDGQTPSQVEVKYLLAASVSNKSNITWAGQTFGSNFASDGRLNGILDVQTIPCNTSTRTCSIRVPAPGFALVFFNDFADQVAATPIAATWPTTAYTRTASMPTIAPSMLATSNGHWGMDERLGSTSPGRKWWLQADGPHRKNGTHKNGALTRQEGRGRPFIIAGIILLRLCV
ncbi:glycoside hydrolase family 79 protein [Mycena alexandri]|uniref:Glycoside hydrolase family 79 protein n=1 Tax=Mycena alexandri TaxID=1745969 RepID=A0AAD6WN42_9AGAR|nr:glycoside hydrolase family 79 protein [Mycena alexandri]KAJ7018832.1 glycoside hydrolase family 79 protein [Mycena alexandri]